MANSKIESFIFKKAQYFVGDKKGNEILLTIGYGDNKFKLKVVSKNGTGLEILEDEARRVAKDLLKRKHGVNFANRVNIK